MKKKLCSMVCLCYFVSIMLCACGRKEQGNPIRLPALSLIHICELIIREVE